MKLIIRWIINGVALFVAAWLIPGIQVSSNQGWVAYAAMAIILSLVNALIRPILKVLTCPLIVLTLGLFTLVINAVTLLLSTYIAQSVFNVDFVITNFWAAFWGALIVSIVSVLLNVFVRDDK